MNISHLPHVFFVGVFSCLKNYDLESFGLTCRKISEMVRKELEMRHDALEEILYDPFFIPSRMYGDIDNLRKAKYIYYGETHDNLDGDEAFDRLCTELKRQYSVIFLVEGRNSMEEVHEAHEEGCFRVFGWDDITWISLEKQINERYERIKNQFGFLGPYRIQEKQYEESLLTSHTFQSRVDAMKKTIEYIENNPNAFFSCPYKVLIKAGWAHLEEDVEGLISDDYQNFSLKNFYDTLIRMNLKSIVLLSRPCLTKKHIKRIENRPFHDGPNDSYDSPYSVTKVVAKYDLKPGQYLYISGNVKGVLPKHEKIKMKQERWNLWSFVTTKKISKPISCKFWKVDHRYKEAKVSPILDGKQVLVLGCNENFFELPLNSSKKRKLKDLISN